MHERPRTDLDRAPAEWAAFQEECRKANEAMMPFARALVVGLMLGAALYAFEAPAWKAVLAAITVAGLNAINIGRHRLQQIAMLAAGVAALVWLQIPVVDRLLAGADKLLDWLGA